jgi:lipopolysaccharide export system protein LptA
LIKRYLQKFYLIVVFFIVGKCSFAQQTILPPLTSDTIRLIQIVQSQTMRQKNVDSATTIVTAAIGVVIKERQTTTTCDSAVLNQRTNQLEAFGNIHINDNDSIHTYAQYLKYIGNTRVAFLKKNVKLTDKKGTLLTEELEYNLSTGIATYKKGGRILNGKTILTSTEGIYYANTKDVYFKKNVHLVDAKYDIKTDSLLYNINTDIATFIAPTRIKSKDGSVIDTKSGTYNLKSGEAVFFDRTAYKDSTRFLIADKMAYIEKTGMLELTGNAKVVDSVNKVTVLGNQIYINKKDNSFLATNKPVMIFYKDKDSTYIAADTLFSGIRQPDDNSKKEIKKDTLKSKIAIDSLFSGIRQKDENKKIEIKNDTLKNKKIKKLEDTAIRYFIGFHHVRIFNDSLQAVSDSLHYSALDSTFKLFGQPVVWNQKTQIAGDTIYLFTEKQKAKRMYIYYNGIIINKAYEGVYNQVAGRTLNAYFKEGEIEYARVKGSPAESIFYPQDDDSAYVGMNRSSGDVIDMYFVNKEVNKIKFINNVDGTLYPIKQIPADKKQLKNFKWQEARRPKNKLELFE